jgi:hypothetical protein
MRARVPQARTAFKAEPGRSETQLARDCLAQRNGSARIARPRHRIAISTGLFQKEHLQRNLPFFQQPFGHFWFCCAQASSEAMLMATGVAMAMASAAHNPIITVFMGGLLPAWMESFATMDSGPGHKAEAITK